jgi:hypothetical protein
MGLQPFEWPAFCDRHARAIFGVGDGVGSGNGTSLAA